MRQSNIKTMLIVFLDRHGVIHKEFDPEETVNSNFHVQVLTCLRGRVNRVLPAFSNNWTLLHDNTPCHGALVVKQLLARFGVATPCQQS